MVDNAIASDQADQGEAILEDWFAPLTLTQFFGDIWSKKVHQSTGASEGQFDELLTQQDIDGFLNSEILPAHYLKVVTADHDFGRNLWAELDTRRDMDAIHIVDYARLFGLFEKGATIIIGASELHFPNIKKHCDALQSYFGFKVKANIYITPENAQGLPLHYDNHDVIVAQIAGKKNWHIHGCPFPEPTRWQNYSGQNVDENLIKEVYELTKGDVFYLPRGWMHDAHSENSYSAHITFGLYQPMLCDVVADIAKQASKDEPFRLRRPLANASKKEWQAFQSQIGKLGDHSLCDIQNVAAKEPVSNRLRFSTMSKPQSLDMNSWVKASISGQLQRKNHGDDIMFVHQGRRIGYPQFLSPMFDQLFSGRAVQIEQLGGLMGSKAKFEIIRELLRAGFLEACPPDE